ncbi:MAG: hypothetical protein RMK20_01190 [Verrucomicrobiales bacterium]|nr:hypothetical protein [Verrucomicrobiales bacterium]
MKTFVLRRLFPMAAVSGMLWAGNGCGRQETDAASPAPASDARQREATAASAPVQPGVSPAALAAQQAILEQIRQAEASARAREYEKAADALLALQRQQALRRAFSEQQAAQYWQQMQRLQADIAAAAAAGDPQARAAADRLRRAAGAR